MTERQQNRNICVVGKVKDGMTIDTSKIKIEDVSERIISIDDSFNTVDATFVSAYSNEKCCNTDLSTISFKGACPAFEAWADKRSVGEKLPRGKYFKSREFIRQFKIQNYV